MDDVKKLLSRWMWRPDLFVKECIFYGAPDTIAPTDQQIAGLKKVGAIMRAKWKHHLIEKGDFLLGPELSDKEKKLIIKLGIAIKSGHGCGKDSFLAWVYLWALVMFNSFGFRGAVTAPTERQLKNILWPEFAKWIKFSKDNGNPILSTLIKKQSAKVYIESTTENKTDVVAFIEARTANINASADEQGETLAGSHGDFMILGCDEASGLPFGIFKPIEGAMTGPCNIAILIGNPTRNNGYFYNCFHSDRARWECLTWNAEESLITSKLILESDLKKYGRDSNWYRSRRLGEFPFADDGSLIPMEWIEEAVNKEFAVGEEAPMFVGIDPAGAGTNYTAVCIRQGPLVRAIHTFNGLDTVQIANMAVGILSDLIPTGLAVDPIGIGQGVYDNLRHMGYKIRPVHVGRQPDDKTRFRNKRAELYWRLREMFEQGRISIPEDEDLMGQLSALKYDDTGGVIKIESKKDMKTESPDKADALMMTMDFRDFAYVKTEDKGRKWLKEQTRSNPQHAYLLV